MVTVFVTITILLCPFNVARSFPHLDQKFRCRWRLTMPLDHEQELLVCVLEEVGFNQILKRPIEVKKFWAQSLLMRLLQTGSRFQSPDVDLAKESLAWSSCFWLLIRFWYNSCLGNTRRWNMGKAFGKLRVQGSSKEYHSKYPEPTYHPCMPHQVPVPEPDSHGWVTLCFPAGGAAVPTMGNIAS